MLAKGVEKKVLRSKEERKPHLKTSKVNLKESLSLKAREEGSGRFQFSNQLYNSQKHY